MRDASEGQADGRNTAVFTPPMANESAQMPEKSCKFPKKWGAAGFFSRAGDPFIKITVPRFLREIWETYKEVTRGLPYPIPDHPVGCECPICLHALENFP